jgi:pimeloyl-ACP methyl ester carboxylesterase
MSENNSGHDRRAFLLAATTLASAPLLAAQSVSSHGGNQATYVLIHGGSHGGWCWERVTPALRSQGHLVYAPSLTGSGDRSHLVGSNVDLELHITDVVNLIKWEGLSNVILVGHSYGGMVITGIADRAPERIGQLVYLDAAHPKNGESLVDVTHGGISSTRKDAKIVNGVELVCFPTAAFLQTLGVTKAEDQAWLMSKLTPQPWRCFEQPLHFQNESALKKIPTTDIWRSMILKQLDPDGTKRASFATRVWEINSPSHDLMVTDPEQVGGMLLRLASI